MSILVRRRQSHPPEDEMATGSNPDNRIPMQRLKSTGGLNVRVVDPPKPLMRARTVLNYDKMKSTSNDIATINRMSVNVVEDLLECRICNKRLRRPKMLPCQHTFCLSCLQGLVQPNSKNMNCPVCRMQVDLKTEGPKGILELPPNLYLDSLLTALQQDTSVVALDHIHEERCSKCQTVSNSSFCQHCKKAFCTVCWSGHISELKSQFQSLLDQLQGAEDRLDHRIQEFRDVCQKLKEHIDVAIDIKIQTLRVDQEKMHTKADELLQQGEETAKLLLERIQTTEGTIAQGADFDALPDNNKKVALFLQLHSMTSGLLEEVSHWGEARPTFDEENFRIDIAEESKTGSEVEESDEVFYEDGNRNIGQVNSPDRLSLYYRSRSFTPRINLGRSVLPRPAGVGVAPWDEGVHMYIAGTDGRQVLVIDRNRMKLVRQLTASNMQYPHGIAFSKSLREVYVTDKWNHCVHVFNSEGIYLRQLGKKGNAEGSFQSPEGIASGPGPDGREDQTFLYVCDTGNDRVQILHPSDGTVVKILGILDPLQGRKIKRTEFNQPTGIAVSKDRIVVVDFGNKRIKNYTLRGEKLNEFGSMGEARGQFQSPECVATDRLGFILVGDSGNARVQIFRPNGTLVRLFGGRGSTPGKFHWVSGITVTNSMDIIVTDSKNSSVQIF